LNRSRQRTWRPRRASRKVDLFFRVSCALSFRAGPSRAGSSVKNGCELWLNAFGAPDRPL
jgi:hypothetical protein